MGASESVPYLGPPYVTINEIQKAKVEVEKAFKDKYGNIFLNKLPEVVDYYAMYCAKERRKGMFRNEQLCAEKVPEIFEEYYSTERDKWNSATQDEKEDMEEKYEEIYEVVPPTDYLPSVQKVFNDAAKSDIFMGLMIFCFIVMAFVAVPIAVIKFTETRKSKDPSIISSLTKQELFEWSLGILFSFGLASIICTALMIYYLIDDQVLTFYNTVFGKMRAESGEKNNTFR